MSQPPYDPRDPWADPPPYGSTPYGTPGPYGAPVPEPYQQPYPVHSQPQPHVQGPFPTPGAYAGQPPVGGPPYGGWPGYGPQPYGTYPGPYSDKTKLAAGLLQLLPGFLLAIGGIGRCYSGHTTLGVIHIVLSVLGWLLTPFLIGIPLVFGCWLWAVIDGIVLLAGQPTDPFGRVLR